MATKVYTSAEFKRERDNFLSLIKNMEKADTKKWLDEVKETLFRSEMASISCFQLHLDDVVSKTILNGFLVEISI